MTSRRRLANAHLHPPWWGLVLWLLTLPAVAGPWTLAPGLTLEPLENFHLSLQQSRALGSHPVLVGYMADEPAYFVAAEAIERRDTRARPAQFWAALEKRLARRNSGGRVTILFSGTLDDGLPQPVNYRAYRYRHKGKRERQLYYLLPASSGYYWLYATAVEDIELDALLPVTHTLVRRALQAPAAEAERKGVGERP